MTYWSQIVFHYGIPLGYPCSFSRLFLLAPVVWSFYCYQDGGIVCTVSSIVSFSNHRHCLGNVQGFSFIIMSHTSADVLKAPSHTVVIWQWRSNPLSPQPKKRNSMGGCNSGRKFVLWGHSNNYWNNYYHWIHHKFTICIQYCTSRRHLCSQFLGMLCNT